MERCTIRCLVQALHVTEWWIHRISIAMIVTVVLLPFCHGMEYDVVIIWYGINVCRRKSIYRRQKWCVRMPRRQAMVCPVSPGEGIRNNPGN